MRAIIISVFLLVTNITAISVQPVPNSDEVPDYPYAERVRFFEDIRDKLNKIRIEIKSLESQSDELYALTGEEHEQEISDLEVQLSELENELAHAKDSTRSGWEQTKSLINQYYAELKRAVDHASAGIKNKIILKRKSG